MNKRKLTQKDKFRLAILNQEITHYKMVIAGVEKDFSEGKLDKEITISAITKNKIKLQNAQKEVELILRGYEK